MSFDTVRAQQILTSAEFRGADANCVYVGCASSGALATAQSQAFALHNLHTALSSGLTGAGQIVAIVDSGFRTTHQEFAGKTIHQSGALPSTDHGTHVASLVAGIQDGKGMHGVAPGADLHLTAINPNGGTALDLANVTTGTLHAASLGAVAQNNSWGFSASAADFQAHLQANPGRSVAQGLNAVIGNYGSANWQTYLDALDRFQTGGVVIWALSNDNAMTSGDVMAALPYFDRRLQGAWVAAANGYFEVDGSGSITKAIRLSAACGLAASFCIAGDGTTTAASATSNTGYSGGTGTSYVAPQIAGTVALLAQAFPDLTPEEWTKRLFASADNSWFGRLGVTESGSVDYGNGVTHAYSGEWGHGVLDIGAALSPIGNVSVLSGDHVATSERVGLTDSVVATPNSFGDGLQMALSGSDIAVFDALNRGYAVEGSALVAAQSTSILPGLLASVERPRWGALPSRRSVLATGPGDGKTGSGTLAVLNSAKSLFETSLDAAPHGGASVFSLARGTIAATSVQRAGPVEITAIGFAGQGTAAKTNTVAGTGLKLAVGEQSRVSLGVSYLGEQGSLLGLADNRAFDWGNGSSLATLHLGLDQQVTSTLGLFGRFEYGNAAPTGRSTGLVTSMSDVQFSAFEIGARMGSVFASQDTLSFSVSQPLRIEAGTMDMRLPTGRFSDGSIEQRQVAADLEPTGRELDLGAGYQVPVGAGQFQLGLQYRLDSGHVAGASGMGVAMGFGQTF
ncbi:MAG: S8 family serine peptidase [Kaiparowitsia implicata GSE-PSE-MK54-09C]|nr:S8 family serine peptidase [Kaiparowitsia implicata GSE-PSE-MK54-09C]